MTLKDAIEWLQKGVDDGFLPEEMALPIVMDAARDMLALGEKRKTVNSDTDNVEFYEFIGFAANLAQKWGG